MDLTLHPLSPADAPALQRVYEACPATFRSLLGRPAPADLAANDFAQAQAMPGRYQLGIRLDDTLIGVLDCKLDDEVAGQAHLGLLLLAPPYDDPDIGALALRILMRWLFGLGVTRLETDVPAHDPAAVAFWSGQEFAFTGEQYRRELPGYAPRFLVMARELTTDDG